LSQFEKYGGQARMNSGVEKITTQNGRVTGVITEKGEEFSADWILSNADPITTCRELIEEGVVSDSFFSRLQSSEIAPSTLNVYMGVDRPHEELGFGEHEIFMGTGYDVDKQSKLMHHIESPNYMTANCYNFAYPDISPPGTSIVVLLALMYGKPWYAVPPIEYVDTKNRIANSMIEMVERISPGLRQYTEVIEVSTPITNMRYAGTMGGSIYGFNQLPRDSAVWRMRHKGPLDGLHFVGAWTQPGGGYEPAIMSGQIAGGAILSKIKKMQKGAEHGD
jgi:prolycopene isomerase